jgi:hypothetical protein
VLCGTGAHGAYHAGVLRAIQEAGVKIDLVAGHGIGAGAAALAAIDGATRLWEPDGLWRSSAAGRFYRWNAFLRGAGWLTLILVLLLLAPVLVLAAGLLIYPAGFLLTLLGLDAGTALVGGYSSWVQNAFAAERMPTIVPRLVMVVLVATALFGLTVAAAARWRSHAGRRSAGAWWWQLIGAPLEADGVRLAFVDAIWHLIRGAAVLERPTAAAVGRRYAEVLSESLGQPGFRELILTATDLDARRDLIVALLRDPYPRSFLAPPTSVLPRPTSSATRNRAVLSSARNRR